MTIHRPIVATTLFSAGLACLSPALAADDDLKSLAERYFRNPFFSNLSISPDGSHFAFYQYRKIPGNQFFEYQRTISTFSVKTNEVRTFVGLDLWGVEAYDWVMRMKEDREDWWLRYLMFDSEGDFFLDIKEHREAYRALSPRFAAENIRAPILLIHGGADSRVEATQAKVMRSALRNARKTHEVAIHSFGGHEFYGARSRIKFFVRVAEFLEKYMQ